MIFKVQRPLFSTDGEYYLVYNKDKSIVSQNLQVGKNPDFDKLFKGDEYKIYVDNNELININDNSFVSLLKIKLIGETVENVVFEHKTYNEIIEFSPYC